MNEPELIYDPRREAYLFTRRHVAPTEVFEHVCKYFEKHLPEYEVMFVIRRSSYKADSDLYMVEAKRRKTSPYGQGDYACWTLWNESAQSMNYGHYDLPDEEECMTILSGMYVGTPIEEIHKANAVIDDLEGVSDYG